MSVITSTYSSNATFTASPYLLGGSVVAIAAGAAGDYSTDYDSQPGAGSVIEATVPVAAAASLDLFIPHKAGGGGGGYATGGGGGAGGGSSAVVDPVAGLQIVGAGGGGAGGAYDAFNHGGNGGTGGLTPGGGYNGYNAYLGGQWGGGGQPPSTGADGVGGVAGATGPGPGPGGPGANGAAGVGGSGGTSNVGGHDGGSGGGGGGGQYGGGGGGGGGPYSGGGGGAGGLSYVSGAVVVASIYTNAGAGYVTIQQTVADPPLAPTITSPANASYQNVSTTDIQFAWTPNPNSSGDTGPYEGYALRSKISGASSYQYWNGTAMQSTLIYNADTSGDILIGTGIFTAGDVYNFSVSTQEGYYGLTGPFAADETFYATTGPSATIVSPAIGSTISVSQPNISFTGAYDGSDTQTSFRVVLYTLAQTEVTGFIIGSGANVWDSGNVSGTGTSIQVGVPLTNTVTYIAYVQLTETGAVSGPWASTEFTVTYDTPAQPVLMVNPLVDPVTQCPFNQCIVQARDNLLSSNDASFETGIGTWVKTGPLAALAQSTTEARDGNYSLYVDSTGAGACTLTTVMYPFSGSYLALTLALISPSGYTGAITAKILWYTAAGASVGAPATVTKNLTTGWQVWSLASASPATAAQFEIELTWTTTGSGQAFYMDCCGVYESATVPVWSRGGMVGNSWAWIQSSIDGGTTWQDVRNATAANPAAIPASTQQVVIGDYEAMPNTNTIYQAFIIGVTS